MHGTIVAVERKKEGGLRSCRVGSGERCSLPDWTLTSLFFFHTAVTISPFIGHFVLPASNRLCCHSISYQKML